MATLLKLTLCLAVLAFTSLSSAAGRPVPANLQKLYHHAKADPNKHAYFVLGTRLGAKLHALRSGVESLSVVAVFYGVWGDTNGGTDVGEASVSLVHACFPDERLLGDNGHEKHDVLYVAFVGKQAKPGAKGANWKASSFNGFETSLAHIGDTLVSKVRV
ncbi:endo-chitosanase [Trichophyton tonsurans CBS 112818]|uniref:Endo-chitosanase n=1 Tax=Trichophyton tonsurans (strain CBS 112818) TaxID=647933 RepID=F2S108_TRIT1|nr:endo-chitosanase [Trichophyton tonsurans CBS 112818]